VLAGSDPLTKGGYVFYTHSRDEAEAFERSKALTLRGVLRDVTCPLLVTRRQGSALPSGAGERIVRERPTRLCCSIPRATTCCNNIPYKYRPAMAIGWRKS